MPAPAASKDESQLRRAHSTTLVSLKSPSNTVAQPSSSMSRPSALPPVQDQDNSTPEPKTPTGNQPSIPATNQPSQIITLSKKIQAPPNTRRVSGIAKPSNGNGVQPLRPTAPLNMPPSIESSATSSVRRANEINRDSPQRVNLNGNGTPARPRGNTVTPGRVQSMFIPSPSRSEDMTDPMDGLISNFPQPPESSPSAPQRAKLPRQTSNTYTDTVPWSSRGSLHNDPTADDTALQLMADPNLPPSHTGSVWGGEGTVTSFGMETEILENEDIDEDMLIALDNVQTAHSTKITQYKRLLEQAHSNSASQLHSLQAELKLLKLTLEKERIRTHQVELARDRERMSQATQQNMLRKSTSNMSLATTLRGDGSGQFNETEVRHAVRSLQMSERMRLITIILDCCIPGDISEQIRLLEKYRRSSFDIVTNLPPDLAVLVLRYLSVVDLLAVETVSKKWQDLVHHPALWRYHCLVLTATDPVPLGPPAKLEDWEPLYRSLHHRETNWKNALPQHIRFLNGHTKFCTTLLLKDKRLISGSYDDTIRIWNLDTYEQVKVLPVGKAVSCMQSEGEVLAVGFHDIGRVHLFSSLTFEPLQQLQGHLYGIKAIALGTTYLVSAGADKALVVWKWRTGEKVVRFGQQINVCIGVQLLNAGGRAEEAERFASVTIDGIVRVFSIRHREVILQFSLAHLGSGNPTLSSKISNVGAVDNMLQWFAADGNQMTCATKSVIIHLEWADESEGSQSSPPGLVSSLSSPTNSSGPRTPNSAAPPVALSRTKTSLNTSTGSVTTGPNGQTPITPRRPGAVPRLNLPSGGMQRTPSGAITGTPKKATVGVKAQLPRVLAVIETQVDMAVGAVDPRKRRVLTSTRFSARTGADRRLFVSTHDEKAKVATPLAAEEVTSPLDTPTATSTVPSSWNSALAAAVAASDPEDGLPPSQPTHSRRSSVGTSYSGQTNQTATSSMNDTRRQLRANYPVDFSTDVEPVEGVWTAMANFEDSPLTASVASKGVEGLQGPLPKGFKGLATHDMNPMSFALSHEKAVVGCSDGTIYIMNFVGYKYSRHVSSSDEEADAINGADGGDEVTPPASISAYDESAYSDTSFGNF